MNLLREVDAYCASCKEVRRHAVVSEDPSACYCNVCGTSQVLMAPVDVSDSLVVKTPTQENVFVEVPA